MPPRLPRSAVPLGALLMLAGLLAGCGNRAGAFAPACPSVRFLSDGADLTRFRGTGADITDTIVDGRLTGAKVTCSLDDDTHLRTVVSVDMDITRGPAARGRIEDVTYFVAISRGDTILTERDFTLPVSFESNTDKVRLTGDQVDLVLPINEKLSGAAYDVRISFRLTPAELAFNRRRGPR